MGTVTIGDTPDVLPIALFQPLIALKADWSGEWEERADLRLIALGITAGGDDLDRCEFAKPYGNVIQPGEAEFAVVEPEDLSDYWVRVQLKNGEGDYETAWVGRVAGKHEDVYGVSPEASGEETFVAYGPLAILSKICVYHSLWQEGGSLLDLGWTPDFNERDRAGTMTGNRSLSTWGGLGSYTFGGEDLWTFYQVIEYLIFAFTEPGGPVWTIEGDVGLVQDATDTIKASPGASLGSLLAAMVNPRRGMDFVILPTDEGFAVKIFSLTATVSSFGEATLAANEDLLVVEMGVAHRVSSVAVVRDATHKYSHIRILGNRIQSAISLTAAGETPTLVKGWTDALLVLYKAAEDPERMDDRFRAVYQSFLATAGTVPEIVTLDDEGYLYETSPPDQQTTVRRTLAHLPMWEGIDYSIAPPTDENPADSLPELRPPFALVFDEDEERYVPADKNGISVSVFRNALGVLLNASPNHVLGLNDFTEDSAKDPVYDWTRLIVTIAAESDQRLELKKDFAGGDGSTLVIEAGSGELWLLPAGTVVGVAANGDLKTVPARLVVRNDNERLHYVMAGALARYSATRDRVTVYIESLEPCGNLVGRILSGVVQGERTIDLDAPVTSIEWQTEPECRTIIRAGYALK